MLHNRRANQPGTGRREHRMRIPTLLRPFAWVATRTWWLLDGLRRAILNLLLLALLIAIAVALFTRGPRPLQEKTLLVLNLDGALVEQHSGTAREQALAQLKGQRQKQTRLRDVLQVLDAAAADEKIWAVALDLDEFGGAGLASLREVAAGLTRF